MCYRITTPHKLSKYKQPFNSYRVKSELNLLLNLIFILCFKHYKFNKIQNIKFGVAAS